MILRPKTRRILFDIESDGLLDTVSRIWVLIAKDLDTGERFCFYEGDLGWQDLLNEAAVIIGHNIIGYDLAVLKKLYNFSAPKTARLHDTMLLSQILDYRRFGMGGHSLEIWGEYFGFPKLAFNDFSQFSPEMEIYCDRDVDLNIRVYDQLCFEFENLMQDNPYLGIFVKNEHRAAQWQTIAQLHGWPMRRKLMFSLMDEITAKLKEAEDALLPKLGVKFVFQDKVKGEIETKKAAITGKGQYHATMAKYFGIEPQEATEYGDQPLQGAFSRVEMKPLKLSYSEDVKIFLYRQGWQPTEWNTKRDEHGKMVKTSPKISDDDLEFLGADGGLYREYTKASARHGILKGWIAALTDDDRLHGDSFIIGTPSMRLRHSIIANIPSKDAAYGADFRRIFTTLPGWTLVGCDSSGNQARGLAHYLGDEQFIDTLLNGDIHQYNADILTEIVRKLPGVAPDYVVPRSAAKRILYAFLFGAAGAKLWGYIFGVANAELGNKLKAEFVRAVPGFDALLKRLNKIYGNTKKTSGWGWIPSIAGNRIYVDSTHKLLVYLLQSCEKATCSAALAMTMNQLEAEGIPYVPLIYYHDEIDFMVPDEYAARAAEIGRNGFRDGPKLYDITIMDGDSKTGQDWLEIH